MVEKAAVEHLVRRLRYRTAACSLLHRQRESDHDAATHHRRSAPPRGLRPRPRDPSRGRLRSPSSTRALRILCRATETSRPASSRGWCRRRFSVRLEARTLNAVPEPPSLLLLGATWSGWRRSGDIQLDLVAVVSCTHKLRPVSPWR